MIETFLPTNQQTEREIDTCGAGRKRRKSFLSINKHCKVTLQYLFVFMLLMISALETLSLLINKIDGIDIPTLSGLFTKAIQDIDIPNATSNAIKNSLLLDMFNKYSTQNTNLTITPLDLG